jgi:hypothetical protein
MSLRTASLLLVAAVGAVSCSRDASAPPGAPSSAGSSGAASAAPAGGELKAGDAAPAFSLPGSDGKTHQLSDHVGKEAVVVAWFPKAFTGG